jgi:hypothetical protein
MDNQKKELPANREDKIAKLKNSAEKIYDSVLISDEFLDDNDSIYEEGLEENTAKKRIIILS